MKRNTIITLAILSGVWASQALAQSTQPAGEREWFVRTVRLPGRKVARQFLRYDFTTGSQIVLESSDSRYFPNIKFMDSRGRHLRLRTRDMAEDSGWGKRIELDGAEPGTPRRVFEQLKVRTWWRAALSPDGRKIVCFDSGEFSIVIGDETSVHVIPTEWWLPRPFSWSPDSRQVAFYYALSDFKDDLPIQEHGVAVLTTEGHLREVVKPSEATATPMNPTGKYVPPGWGRSGRSVYYTAGLPPDDPQRESDAARALYPVTGTYRVNIETGGTEKIALGDFACVSPDEEYVLVYPAPKLDGEGKWVKGGAKVLLETKKVTYLPDDVRYPRISPSGKLAACLSRKGGVRCFQTADCKPYGRRVPKTGFNIEEWFTDLRWIVVEQEGSN